MIENNVLEALVPQLVERIEALINKRYPHEYALRTVLRAEAVDHHFTLLEIEQLDTAVRISLQHRSLERARLSPHTKEASAFVGGRIPPRSGRSRFSGRDLAAGAEVEERRDEREAELQK